MFYSTGPCGLCYKSFKIVIYDGKDNDLYYKTMIIANLALARSVNYDCKVCCRLKHIFDCKLQLYFNPRKSRIRSTAVIYRGIVL